MRIFDRYLFRQLFIATLFTGAVLTAIVFLTQSLQFLELVMNSGASSGTFWLLTLLALPRFLEIIMPIALMASVVFVYNRMTMDSELVVMRAVGASPGRLARPALYLSVAMTILLWITSIWVAPATETNMDVLRTAVKSQFSTLLFHEGIFNPVRPGLTVFIRDRALNGELHGILIYDSRKKAATPVVVAAKRGEIVMSDAGQQVLVYDGDRQSINPKTHNLDQLHFDRYLVDLPSNNGPVRSRWREPSERSFSELLHPNMADPHDAESGRAFRVELHRRLVSPLLALAYSMLALSCLLLGPVDRRGQNGKVILAVASVVLIQSFYMAAFNLSRHTDVGLVLMYLCVFAPLISGGVLLGSGRGWRWRLLR